MIKSESKIIFMGTPEFAVPVLELVNQELGVTAVVTIPDKHMGRGRKLKSSAVKDKALQLGLPVLEPVNLKDEKFIKDLTNFEPDIMLVVAFKILPPEVYSISKLGTFNIHASLLPDLRGAAPINWAIINGCNKTGLTTFLIDRKVDTGNILLTEEFNIPNGATAGDLHDIMMPKAAKIGLDTCKLLINGNYTAKVQDHTKATPAPKLFPENASIDWNRPSAEVRNFIHGYSPIPGARTTWDGKILKIFRVEDIDNNSLKPGEYHIDNHWFIVGCEEGSVYILELQLEGKRKVDIKSFLNGVRQESKGYFT